MGDVSSGQIYEAHGGNQMLVNVVIAVASILDDPFRTQRAAVKLLLFECLVALRTTEAE